MVMFLVMVVRTMVYRTVTNALDNQRNEDQQEAKYNDQIDTVA